MQEVIQFLQENPVQYLATVGRDGRAKCRPFMFSGELDGKLWFCTNHTKEVYQDMQRNPYIEITTSSPEYAWLRLSGEATFENNMAAKEMCMRNPIVKGQYGGCLLYTSMRMIFAFTRYPCCGKSLCLGSRIPMHLPGFCPNCGERL